MRVILSAKCADICAGDALRCTRALKNLFIYDDIWSVKILDLFHFKVDGNMIDI